MGFINKTDEIITKTIKAVDNYLDVKKFIVKQEELRGETQPQVVEEQPKTTIAQSDIFNLDKIKFIESSNGGYNEDGSFLVNEKGAVGPYQIIPSMAKDPGFGIKGIDVMNTTEEEHRAYAKDYLTQALVYFKKTFPNKDNYEDMALASYNYGIPATTATVKKHGNLHWRGHLPDETRGYLDKYYKE